MFQSKQFITKLLIVGLVLLVLLSGCMTEVDSDTISYAGLLVRYADGSQMTMCIEFEGEEISGEELLNLSELPYVADVTNPMGSRVCSINEQGCEFPAEKCFCECGNIGPCTYWAYFALIDGEQWVYAPVGAKGRKVHQGDVDAWAWFSKASKDEESVDPTLPVVTFEEICGKK